MIPWAVTAAVRHRARTRGSVDEPADEPYDLEEWQRLVSSGELPAQLPRSAHRQARPLSPNNGERGRGWRWKKWRLGGEQAVVQTGMLGIGMDR